MEQLDVLVKSAAPFRTAPDDFISKLTGLSHRVTFNAGDVVYKVGDQARNIYIVASGSVRHSLGDASQSSQPDRTMRSGDVFGWASVLEGGRRHLATTTCLEKTEVVVIDGDRMMNLFRKFPAVGNAVMGGFAAMIRQDFSLPKEAENVYRIANQEIVQDEKEAAVLTGFGLMMYRVSEWLKSPKPYLMMIGFALFLGFWYFTVEVWKLPRFQDMPGLTTVVTEYFSRDPIYGMSIYTPEYYQHIWVSIRRVAIAFLLATALGVPLGLFLGWSRTFREYVFPIFELLRPIPILAWVPLAILMFTGSETPVIFLTFLASFFATALNTMLGVESIDESYTRAAACLGASRWQVFREVIVPGSLPFVFTGLQISVGVAWFSLVAGEMVSGQYGLGYVINTSYTMVRYPTIIIGMVTLGVVGYVTSAMVRVLGDYLMQWRVREESIGGR
jgi:NitT/TauT family transport system permease protein